MAVSPKQSVSSLKAKRGRPPKNKLFRKKVSRLDNMTVNQLVSHEKEKAHRQKRKRATSDDLYENDEVKSAVMKRAAEVQVNLSSKFPSLIKYMLRSHVTGGFWLGLPKEFCSKHLPKEDKMIVLEDEEGEEYATKYLVQKVGLSGGWRGFSIAHNLLEGDACVFHLVKPSRFKVYVVRRKGSDEVDVAIGLLKLEASIQTDLGLQPKICGKTIDKSLENFEVKKIKICEDTTAKIIELEKDNSMENYWLEDNKICKETTGKSLEEVLQLDLSPASSSGKLEPIAYHSENDSEELGFEVLDGIRLTESVIDFKEVKSFEDFKIVVNGLILNSELSKYLQMKYYELCCSQKSYLHDHVLEGLNCKLVAGIIAETVNIADAVRAAKLTNPHHSFLTWNQTLKSFVGLGMKVGFLSARLDQLLNLSLKSKRYQEAKLEQVNAKEEKRKLEAKLLEMTEALTKLDGEIGSLEEESADRLEILFQEVANAPW